jgi:hypothetical protein
MEAIELDRETHRYTPNLPSVTEILEAAGLIDTAWFTEESRERGSAVHRACELFDLGELDFESLDDRIEPYVRAYIRFRASRKDLIFDWIETPMMDGARVYAGCADRILQSQERAVWDLKTGDPKPADRYQLAAYVNLLDDPFSYSRACLYLRQDATYQVREFPKDQYIYDLNVFNAALTIYYAKQFERI